MSITFCAHLHKKCLDEKALYNMICAYFAPTNQIAQEKRERCIFYNGFDKDNAIDIAFVEQTNYPYNIWESDILNQDFSYAQEIIFGIAKEKYSIDTYQKIIDFCIFLKNQIDTAILLTSDVHNDICFLDKKGIILSKKKYGIDYF